MPTTTPNTTITSSSTISLIREYNGGYFISDKNTRHLPYNPDEHILTVTDQNGNIYRQGETITTGVGETLNLYYSDGSMSTLGENSTLIISDIGYKSEENNLLTKVKLFLSAGSIFTKATALDDGSDFEIYTSDTAAAVRGTIFLIETTGFNTTVSTLEGQVEVFQQKFEEGQILELPREGGAIIEEGSKTDIYNGMHENTSIYSYPIYEEDASINNFLESETIIQENIPDGKDENEIESSIESERNTLGEEWEIAFYDGFDKSSDDLINISGTNTSLYEIEEIQAVISEFTINSGSLFAEGQNGYLKYNDLSRLNLEEDFAIEMEANILNDGNIHYLIHAGNLKIYTQFGFLYYNNGVGTDYKYSTQLKISEKNNIYIKYEVNTETILLKTGENNWENSNKVHTGNLDNLIVGALNLSGSYYMQLNDKIDYIKIYKK